MPAPHRRNKGESLAEKIAKAGHVEGLSNRRDRQHAHSARHSEKWEGAASTLEQRADRARIDHERGKQFERYDTAVRQGKAKPPVVVLAPGLAPRYWLGHCLACDGDLWVRNPRPRVPICERCRS